MKRPRSPQANPLRPFIRRASQSRRLAGASFIAALVLSVMLASAVLAQASSSITISVSPTSVAIGQPITASGNWERRGCPTNPQNWVLITWGDGAQTVMNPAPGSTCSGSYSAQHAFAAAGSYQICAYLGHTQETGQDTAAASACFPDPIIVGTPLPPPGSTPTATVVPPPGSPGAGSGGNPGTGGGSGEMLLPTTGHAPFDSILPLLAAGVALLLAGYVLRRRPTR